MVVENTMQVNNLCFSYNKFRDLVEDSPVGENVYFLNSDHGTIWQGRRFPEYIHIKVMRDTLEIHEILSSFCPVIGLVMKVK